MQYIFLVVASILCASLQPTAASFAAPPVPFNVFVASDSSATWPQAQLVDINGDGLPDFVNAYLDAYDKHDPVLETFLNTGSSWERTGDFSYNETSTFAKDRRQQARFYNNIDRVVTVLEKATTAFMSNSLDILTDEQAAQMLQISNSTMVKILESGEIFGRRLDGTWRVARKSILKYMTNE